MAGQVSTCRGSPQGDPFGTVCSEPADLGPYRFERSGVRGVHRIAEHARREAEQAEPLGDGFRLVLRVAGVPASGKDDDVRGRKRADRRHAAVERRISRNS